MQMLKFLQKRYISDSSFYSKVFLLIINPSFFCFPLFENFAAFFPIQIYEFYVSVFNILINFIINKMVIETNFRGIFFCASIIDSFRSSPINGSQTHWARLAGSVNNTIIKLKRV